MTRRWLPLAAAGLLLAGCGESPGYDHAAVEDYLVKTQAATFGSGDTLDKASCPADLDLSEGMTFTCTLHVSGAKLPYRVKLTDVHDEESVSVNAEPAGVLVSATRLRAHVRTTLPKASAGADLDCGGPFVVATVGKSFDCLLVLGSQAKPLTMKVLDDRGRIQVGS